jgi:LDH2 family malate/lactate/ureidoglycolate dehydrogenase
MNEASRYSPAERLREFSQRVFEHFGVPAGDASQAAAVLAAADLRGVDSHGVARLRSYLDMLTLGRINPKANFRVVRESAGAATVDGDNGLGLVVAPKANDLAMAEAESVGNGSVGVCTTNHFGIAGHHPLPALERGVRRTEITAEDIAKCPLTAKTIAKEPTGMFREMAGRKGSRGRSERQAAFMAARSDAVPC